MGACCRLQNDSKLLQSLLSQKLLEKVLKLMCLQADFEPNSRKLRGHERIPAIYESEVCSAAHTSCAYYPTRPKGGNGGASGLYMQACALDRGS